MVGLKVLIASAIALGCYGLVDGKCNIYQFECAGGKCIRFEKFCDSWDDCGDASDEPQRYITSRNSTGDGKLCRSFQDLICHLPPELEHRRKELCRENTSCTTDEFECQDGSGCIHGYKFCDGGPDCIDGSDEPRYDKSRNATEFGLRCMGYRGHICYLPAELEHARTEFCEADASCDIDQFECQDGSGCVTSFCDHRFSTECSDGSDEIRFNKSSHEDQRKCRVKDPAGSICFLPANQEHKRTEICEPDASCTNSEFECEDGSGCLTWTMFCNRRNECGDSSDERLYDPSLPGGIKCEILGRHCMLPNRYLCDGFQHCDDGADECFCEHNRSDVYADKSCFRCLDESFVIKVGEVCDGVFHCSDLSDECLCADKLENVAKICGQVEWTGYPYTENFACVSNYSSVNMTVKNVCDGSVDCVDAEDESLCRRTSGECTDIPNDLSSVKCDHDCFRKGILESITLEDTRAKRCDGRFTCYSIWHEECKECDDPPPVCNYVLLPEKIFLCQDWFLFITGPNLCDGVKHCTNGEDEQFCPHKFYCGNSTTDHVPAEKKCDLIKDCEDSSDELDCLNSTIGDCETATCEFTHFYCNDGGATVYINRRAQVCDGNEDCTSGIDECQNCTEGFFSSDDYMISATAMVPFLVIMSFMAVSGNIAAIIWALLTLTTERRKMSRNEKVQRILIANLSTADLLVGVYTTAMCFLNFYLSSDRYCLKDHSWRSNIACSLFGAILVVGSEASIFAMIIITIVRINAVSRVLKPFSTRKLVLLLALAWILSVCIAVVPFLPFAEDYFIESLWYKENVLGNKMNQQEMPQHTMMMLRLMKIDNNSSFVAENGYVSDEILCQHITWWRYVIKYFHYFCHLVE